jgi:hypothetical protein
LQYASELIGYQSVSLTLYLPFGVDWFNRES